MPVSRNSQSDPGRRQFFRRAGAGFAGLALASHVPLHGNIMGANDRVRVAVIGLKRRGLPLIAALGQAGNVDVTWVCEVDERQMEAGLAHAEETLGYLPGAEKDLRKIVERKDVDAIVLALPDHWHAYATVLALANGKHVYVEKPCSYNLEEDDLLIKAAEKYPGLVIQMGNQQRSSPETQEVITAIHGGLIGEVYQATSFYSNARGPVPVPKEVPPPDFLDWELWQGPVPRRPYLDILEDYFWHWRWHWGTAESANNGTHELDVARWALQVSFPEQVETQSGKYHYLDDGWEMYDTMHATFRFPGNKVIEWDGKSRNGFNTYGAGRGTIIYGTEGSVFVDREHYRVYNREGELLETRSGEEESGIGLGGGGNLTDRHVRNFIEAIRGREKPNAPIIEGALSTHLVHYPNVASRLGDARLEVDPETGRFRDAEAMKRYWGRAYEPGWEIRL